MKISRETRAAVPPALWGVSGLIAGSKVKNSPEGLSGAYEFDSKFTSLQEDLHRRIASELHDTTCQHLIAASLIIMQIRTALYDPRKADSLCEQVDVSVNQALKELRSLTYLLHPQHLLEEGLKATIEKFAEGFAARTSLRIGITISPAVRRLSYETQRSLMRIVQEALTNVHRHARATKVEIAIGERKKYFKLEIRDNGQGMFARRACRDRLPPLGTGLRIMRARLQEMGGRLEILSAPTTRRRGTIVRATLPFGHAIERIDRMRELKKTH